MPPKPVLPTAPPPVNAAPVQAPKSNLTFSKPTTFAPPRIVLNAVEGWGKTTFLAYAPEPAIIQVGTETGYETLYGNKRVPACDCVRVANYEELNDAASEAAKAGYANIGFDALGGCDEICQQFVCERDFKGDWSERGFMSFQVGYRTAGKEWQRFLKRLSDINFQNIGIIILSHSDIVTFKNPMGADFDRYVAKCSKEIWAPTHKFADAVLFGNTKTIVDVKARAVKGKGIGGNERVLYTERRDTHDAKNRYGMPPEIEIPDDPAQVYSTIMGHINGGNK